MGYGVDAVSHLRYNGFENFNTKLCNFHRRMHIFGRIYFSTSRRFIITKDARFYVKFDKILVKYDKTGLE